MSAKRSTFNKLCDKLIGPNLDDVGAESEELPQVDAGPPKKKWRGPGKKNSKVNPISLLNSLFMIYEIQRRWCRKIKKLLAKLVLPHWHLHHYHLHNLSDEEGFQEVRRRKNYFPPAVFWHWMGYIHGEAIGKGQQHPKAILNLIWRLHHVILCASPASKANQSGWWCSISSQITQSKDPNAAITVEPIVKEKVK
jgi:hypothetical protein